MAKRGLHVTVEGDLPREVLEKINVAVRKAVALEIAELDLFPGCWEQPCEPPILGIVYLPGLGPDRGREAQLPKG
jgi:hypothetical protein